MKVLNAISNEEKCCIEDIRDVAKYKTHMIIKRLIEINNVILGMVEKNSNELKQILLNETPVVNHKKNDANVKNTIYISPDHYKKLNIPNFKDNIESFVNNKSRNIRSISKRKSKGKSFKNLVLPNLTRELNIDEVKFQKFNKSIKKEKSTDNLILKSMAGTKKENIISTFNLLPKLSLLDDASKPKGWSSNKTFLTNPKKLKKNPTRLIKLVKNNPISDLNTSADNFNINLNCNSMGKNSLDNIRFHHLFILKKKNKEEKSD